MIHNNLNKIWLLKAKINPFFFIVVGMSSSMIFSLHSIVYAPMINDQNNDQNKDRKNGNSHLYAMKFPLGQ